MNSAKRKMSEGREWINSAKRKMSEGREWIVDCGNALILASYRCDNFPISEVRTCTPYKLFDFTEGKRSLISLFSCYKKATASSEMTE